MKRYASWPSARLWRQLLFGLFTLSCDSLQLRPGSEFEIELLTDPPIKVRQQVGHVEVRFRLPGCDDFSLLAQDRARVELTHRMMGDGVHTALVPVTITTEGACSSRDGAPHRGNVSLVATCRRDGRSVAARLPYEAIATAWNWTTWGPGTFTSPTVLSGAGVNRWIGVGGGRLFVADITGAELAARYAPVFVPAGEQLEDALVVSDGTRVYLSWTCPQGLCTPSMRTIEVGGVPRSVISQSLFVFSLSEGRVDFDRTLEVPAHADMAFDARGDLVLMGSGVLTKVRGSSPPTFVDVGARIPQSSFTRLSDGRLAFLAWSVDHLELIATDGSPVESFQGAQVKTGTVRMDPERPRWLVWTQAGVWLGRSPQQWDPLTVDSQFAASTSRVTWLPDAVVLWDSQRVQLVPFSGSTRAGLLWSATPVGGLSVEVRGVAGNERRLVITTTSSVFLFDRSAQIIGGANPLPCGLSPTSAPALVGPRALFTTDAFVMGLDLSGS